jgi:serine O-acetyltransferase
MNPERIWATARSRYARGRRLSARFLKAVLFIFFRAVLPPEAVVGPRLRLGHWGMNVVVHPNVTIGADAMIWHGVTIAVTDSLSSPSRILIGDRVTIGTGAVIVSREGQSLTICDDVSIGANAVVTRNLEVPGTYVGTPAKLVVA